MIHIFMTVSVHMFGGIPVQRPGRLRLSNDEAVGWTASAPAPWIEPQERDGPADEAIRSLAARRLSHISATLGLEADHFKRAHDAAQLALDGAGAKILSDQGRAVSEALADISDPLVRARLVGLFAALADDRAP